MELLVLYTRGELYPFKSHLKKNQSPLPVINILININ